MTTHPIITCCLLRVPPETAVVVVDLPGGILFVPKKKASASVPSLSNRPQARTYAYTYVGRTIASC
jgi:hypothetical protein